MRPFIQRAICGAAMAAALTTLALAADTVVPATAAVISQRDEAVVPVSDVTYFRLATLRLSNCVAYASADTNTAQGLDGVTVQIRISNGDSLTNSTCYTGTVVSASEGTWWKDIQIPDYNDCYLQVRLIDAVTNSYIYPWKIVRTKDPLQ